MNQKVYQAFYQFSSPEISDALDACGINGYISKIMPIGKSGKLVGPAYTLQYRPYEEPPKDFMQASHYIDDVPQGAVVFIHNEGNLTCSVWGSILSHFAHRQKIAGTVVYGAVRDVHLHEKYDYPVYACGITPRTGKNRVRLVSQKQTLQVEGVPIHFNDIVFADSTGTIIIPKDKANQVLSMVQNISHNECLIHHAIDLGKSLKEAREMHHYDKPWEKDK